MFLGLLFLDRSQSFQPLYDKISISAHQKILLFLLLKLQFFFIQTEEQEHEKYDYYCIESD